MYCPRRVSANPAPPATQPDGGHANNQLDLQLPPVKFDAVGLSDVIDFLRDVNGAKFSVNWKALEAAGVKPQTPITANIRNGKFSKALRIVLDAAGGAKDKLGYEIGDGAITISTTADLVRTKIYHLDRRFLEYALARDNGADLVRLIKDTVDPEHWDANGKACSIEPKKGELVVTQTTDHQQSIVYLLNQLVETHDFPVLATQPTTLPVR